MVRTRAGALWLGLGLVLLAGPVSAAESSFPWKQVTTVAGGIAVASWADEDARAFFLRNRGFQTDGLADQVRVLGRPLVYASVSAGWLGIGIATRDPDILAAAGRVTATVALAGLSTRGLKYAVGRARPSRELGPHAFDPFSTRTSFPSGHATMAFALAEAVSHEAGHRGVTTLCYGLATLTAWSRLNDDNHWLSDTLTGAALGVACGRLVQWGSRRWGRGSLALFPAPGGPALAWTRGF